MGSGTACMARGGGAEYTWFNCPATVRIIAHGQSGGGNVPFSPELEVGARGWRAS